ncbi:competence protein CoiA [Sporosarcina sp. PTS2304]|uniref:competence protein CoiA n=1 Tax=Sporosarcina sp. PTS2304 TaxID=2283194 RepID=UPI0013B4072C|nr:competence protein CoiA family protein [Sporosarcina sp. PTS2304]
MLTACTSKGQTVALTRNMSLSGLREWRKSERFYCTQCKEKVQLKVGDIVIPHFAHYQQTNCRENFSEGESPAHLLGKAQLHELFLRQGIEVALEPFLPDIRQRPDLLVTWQDTCVPIEFQCSVIPLEHVIQRNEGYSRLHMLPIWIIITPASIRTSTASIHSMRLTQFQQFFIRRLPSRTESMMTLLLTYNPSSEQFHYLSHMIHLHGSAYIVRHSIMRIRHQSIPFALPVAPSKEDISELTRHYQQARRKYLRTVIGYNQRGVHNQFLRACYEMRIQPIELPVWIGVPTIGQEAFKQADCEWQTLLIAAMRETRKTPFQLTRSFYQEFIKKFEGNREEQLEACVRYADFLRGERIDIYRLDKYYTNHYVQEILLQRFLALHAKN